MTKIEYEYAESHEDEDIEDSDYIIETKFDHYIAFIHWGKELGKYDTEEEALKVIIEDIKKEGYYPNIWSVSDHGNRVLINITSEIDGF